MNRTGISEVIFIEYSLVLRNELVVKPVVEKDGDNKVGKAHARKDESPEGPERPERHLEFALGFFRVLERKDQAQSGHKKADGGQCAENDQKKFIGQGNILSITCGLEHISNTPSARARVSRQDAKAPKIYLFLFFAA
jgi:hypothetical protein